MFSRGWKYCLPILAMMALAALACALPGPDDEMGTIEEEGSEVLVENPDSETGDEDRIPLAYTGLGTGQHNSYRLQFEMTFVGTDTVGSPVDMAYSVNQVYSAAQPAMFVVSDSNYEGTEAAKEAPAPQFTRIGDTVYAVSGGECEVFSIENIAPEELSGLPDDFLAGADLSGAERVLPNEDINGVMTRHYHFTDQEVDLSELGLTDVTGDIWVAVNGNFVVRLEVYAKQDGEGRSRGRLEWSYDLSEINAPVNISPPDGCESP